MLTIDSMSQAMGLDVIALRLICALLIGMVIGTERESAHRPAGMRTHMLVALGSCTVMITSQLLFSQYSALGANSDPARLSAQVISGVGFLGAGTIIREGANVKGLTTAASIWAVACLGVAVGAGYYFVCLLGTGCMLITLVLFEWIQKKYLTDLHSSHTGEVCCRSIADGFQRLNECADRLHVDIRYTCAERIAEGTYKIVFQAGYHGRGADRKLRAFLGDITADPDILSVKSRQNAT